MTRSASKATDGNLQGAGYLSLVMAIWKGMWLGRTLRNGLRSNNRAFHDWNILDYSKVKYQWYNMNPRLILKPYLYKKSTSVQRWTSRSSIRLLQRTSIQRISPKRTVRNYDIIMWLGQRYKQTNKQASCTWLICSYLEDKLGETLQPFWIIDFGDCQSHIMKRCRVALNTKDDFKTSWCD
jgi:hypothetical protein